MDTRSVMIEGIVNNIRRLFQVLTESSRNIEQETGLTPGQMLAVKMIHGAAPMKVSDLARAMYVHPATVVGLLDRLEAKGLVQRTRSEEDRRVVHLDLTEKGKKLVEHAPDDPKRHILQGLESLTEGQLEEVAHGMEQLIRIIHAEEVPPQLIMSPEVSLPIGQRKASGRV